MICLCTANESNNITAQCRINYAVKIQQKLKLKSLFAFKNTNIV